MGQRLNRIKSIYYDGLSHFFNPDEEGLPAPSSGLGTIAAEQTLGVLNILQAD
jgi:hypothetical protein